jgi:hypothetical protein
MNSILIIYSVLATLAWCVLGCVLIDVVKQARFRKYCADSDYKKVCNIGRQEIREWRAFVSRCVDMERFNDAETKLEAGRRLDTRSKFPGV